MLKNSWMIFTVRLMIIWKPEKKLSLTRKDSSCGSGLFLHKKVYESSPLNKIIILLRGVSYP